MTTNIHIPTEPEVYTEAPAYIGRENEEALIGAILRDGEQYERASEIVKPEDFENIAYGSAWLACEHLRQNEMSIDTITVGDELERMNAMTDFSQGMWSGRALLSTLRENGDPRNVMAYAENVQDMSVKRKLDIFLTKSVMWAKNGRRSKDIVHDINSELSKITLYSGKDEYTVPIGVAVSEGYEETDKASKGEIVGVPTGFIDLDKLLGSLYAGNVYLIAARPSQGKTAFLLTVARHVAKTEKKRVGIFSLEMSRAQVAKRLVSMESEVNLNHIIRGDLEDREWSIYTDAIERVSDYPIIINDLTSININQIRQTARKIKSSGGLDLLMVDYIQLADSGERRNERRELDVSTVSRGLKYLARELGVPILAAAQLSRAVEQRQNQKPILSDLRESGSLEQDADAVMFIYRPDPDKSSSADIIIAKHRNGPTGNISLMYRAEITKFENATTRFENFGNREDQ